MSNRDIAKSLIDQVPEYKLVYIIHYLEGAIIPDEIPNDETTAAFEELENGDGFSFSGSTDDLMKELLEG